ncbi:MULTISPECIES: hypothetical protein [unclassified Streptomyces]|uniref:hypothetical protein n=1 Tax=unclassified Streptomyces TaxID=2593676 RepID=UPI002E2D8781|nr:hypothetical protein [Streptomyces sp. NBC_01429]
MTLTRRILITAAVVAAAAGGAASPALADGHVTSVDSRLTTSGDGHVTDVIATPQDGHVT